MALETFQFTPEIAAKLRESLPAVASATAAAVIAEVPGYSDLRGPEGATLDQAVELALRGFLSVASGSSAEDAASPLQPALDGAYALGRGEVRSGRTMDVLLSAYRIGARAAWREWSAIAIESGLTADLLSRFAELNFAYIDQLSAASVAGYADEIETRDQSRQRRLERLVSRILAGGPPDALQADAERAGWEPPDSLSAVLLPAARSRGIGGLIDARSLRLGGDLPGLEGEDKLLLLVPTIGGADRRRLSESLAGRQAIIGPERPWSDAGLSYARVLKVLNLNLAPEAGAAVDADDHLVDLVVASDPDAARDLRVRVLAPLDSVRPSTAAKLKETLRAWLLHQGRRDDVAAALHVHPQTVRYRMGQLRDLYGESLDDPEVVLAATIALAIRN